MPCYSELTPIQEGASGHLHFRGKTVQRAIKSVLNQQFPDWELILVDDGCADGLTPDILDKFAASDERISVIHQVNQNRAFARNAGMDAARGIWLCWLDCDDEYTTNYLRELYHAILEFPDYKLFNFGSLIYWPDFRTTTRPVFTPQVTGQGHEWFKSGHIGAGSFIFRRDLWLTRGTKPVRTQDEEGNVTIAEAECQIYRIPDELNPYQFAAASLFDMRYSPEHPDWEQIENPAGAFWDGAYRHGLSLGNPWGEDALSFYLLTRDNLSKPLELLLYIQYPRAHEEKYQHFGEIYDSV